MQPEHQWVLLDWCDCRTSLLIRAYADGTYRVQHGPNPEHAREYGPAFLRTEGYREWVTQLHEREGLTP